jgi:purine-nucleoside phosphorylase
MAEVTEIICSRAFKMNLGNYESVDVFLSMRAVLDDFDDPAEEVEKLAVAVEAAALVQLQRAYKARGKKVGDAEIKRRHGIA